MIVLLMQYKDQLPRAGIEINKQDRLGRTVLHLAAQHGLLKVTKLLIDTTKDGGFCADINVGDLINQRAIHYAVQFKHTEVFDELLQNLCIRKSSEGDTTD